MKAILLTLLLTAPAVASDWHGNSIHHYGDMLDHAIRHTLSSGAMHGHSTTAVQSARARYRYQATQGFRMRVAQIKKARKLAKRAKLKAKRLESSDAVKPADESTDTVKPADEPEFDSHFKSSGRTKAEWAKLQKLQNERREASRK